MSEGRRRGKTADELEAEYQRLRALADQDLIALNAGRVRAPQVRLNRMVRAPFLSPCVTGCSHMATWMVLVAVAVGFVYALLTGADWTWQFLALLGWLHVLWWEVAARRSDDPSSGIRAVGSGRK